MLYFHLVSNFPSERISKQDFNIEEEIKDGKILVTEPTNIEIPSNIIRRMGKGVRMAVKCALPIFKNQKINAIIIGTSSVGQKDCTDFLQQLQQYAEGKLTPVNFVKGVPNSIATQLALINSNIGYNNTHVHRGLAFECALLDAQAYLNEFEEHQVIVGSVDEISTINFKIDVKGGHYHGKSVSTKSFYSSNYKGTVAGEGASMFLVSKDRINAIGRLVFLKTSHCSTDVGIRSWVSYCLDQLPKNIVIDALVSGEIKETKYNVYSQILESLFPQIPVIRFKHLCGDFPTASSIGLGISIQLINNTSVHFSCIKNDISIKKRPMNVLVYNQYRDMQYSLMLVSAPYP